MSGEPIDEYVLGRPTPALAGLVSHHSGYRVRGAAPAEHRGLPAPYLTLIFTLDEPLHVVAHPDPGQPPAAYDALVGGLHTTPALIRHDGAQSGVQVHLDPLAARPLLGLPAGEIARLDLDAADLLGAEVVEQIRSDLLAAPDWTGRFAAADTGYYDQSHLTRDFAVMAGPTAAALGGGRPHRRSSCGSGRKRPSHRPRRRGTVKP